MVTLAAEPGGFARTQVFQEAWADPRRLAVRAGPLRADAGGVDVALGDAHVHARFTAPRPWPRRAWGALGPGHLVPGLPQYWTPHLLGAQVTGEALGRRLDGCRVYAEKNWGAAFAPHWWWGQAHFGDDAGVAFAGGRQRIGAPTAIVVWAGDRLFRLAPPFARTLTRSGGGEWRVRARTPLTRIELAGEATAPPLRLAVPIPAERRLEVRAAHHLLATVRVTVRHGSAVAFRGESALAALEDGRRPGAGERAATAPPAPPPAPAAPRRPGARRGR